jgi:hypothetical protein
MSVNFSEAAKRHFADGAMLMNADRMMNASQLFGLAAECALKAALHERGFLILDTTGVPQKHLRLHIDRLWDTYNSLMNGPSDNHFLMPQTSPFINWQIAHRYYGDIKCPASSLHQQHAGASLALQKLQLD